MMTQTRHLLALLGLWTACTGDPPPPSDTDDTQTDDTDDTLTDDTEDSKGDSEADTVDSPQDTEVHDTDDTLLDSDDTLFDTDDNLVDTGLFDTYLSVRHNRSLLPHTGVWTQVQTVQVLGMEEDTGWIRHADTFDTAPNAFDNYPSSDDEPARVYTTASQFENTLQRMNKSALSQTFVPLLAGFDDATSDLLVTWGRNGSACPRLTFNSAWINRQGKVRIHSAHFVGASGCPDVPFMHMIALEVPEGTATEAQGVHRYY